MKPELPDTFPLGEVKDFLIACVEAFISLIRKGKFEDIPDLKIHYFTRVPGLRKRGESQFVIWGFQKSRLKNDQWAWYYPGGKKPPYLVTLPHGGTIIPLTDIEKGYCYLERYLEISKNLDIQPFFYSILKERFIIPKGKGPMNFIQETYTQIRWETDENKTED